MNIAVVLTVTVGVGSVDGTELGDVVSVISIKYLKKDDSSKMRKSY